MEPIGVFLSHFHGLQLLQAGAFGHFVFCASICIAFKMPNIGHVAHIANFIPQVKEIAINDIKTHKSAAIAQVYVIVNGWTAHVHADSAWN